MSDRQAELLEAVQAAFQHVLPEATEHLKPEDELIDIGVGSIHALEMAGELEERYGVAVPQADLILVRTVGDFIALLEKLLGEGS
jgi:acyl carrier protein